MKKGRPVLRYHGGKWKLAPWIISHFPRHRVYVEPYGGAASVLIRKDRCYAEVYNDLDGEIVNLFRVLRNDEQAKRLKHELWLTPFARIEFAESYVTSDDPVEQARRTVVRSFMGFGSAAASGKPTGFRSNSNRSGTTPAHDWKNYPDALDGLIERLRGVVIESRDALKIMPRHDGPETLFYVDPPYVNATRDKGSDYRHEMTDSEHEQLASYLQSVRGMVVVSGYPSTLYSDLYKRWRLITKDAHADGARDRVEGLWLNHAACEQGSLLEVA